MIDRCTMCASSNWSITERLADYEVATCSDCGLTFTRNPGHSSQRYLAMALDWLQRVYQAGRDGTRALCVPRARHKGASGNSLLVIAE
jgi:hypothetical protein